MVVEASRPEVATPVDGLLEAIVARSSQTARLEVTGPGSFVTLTKPITPRELTAHCAGRNRIGAIPFIDPNRVGWACIDLDCLNWGIDPDAPEAHDVVRGIVGALTDRGLRAHVERSQGKGWHVWTVFEKPVSAEMVRRVFRHVALSSGARDETDLVCPRQDRADGPGNGTWLPCFNADSTRPHTRFHEFDAEGDLVEAESQVAVLREMAAEPTPSSAVIDWARALEGAEAKPEGDWHGCEWMREELLELDLDLSRFAVSVSPQGAKLQLPCPFHESKKLRARGGSAVLFSDGAGHCSSTRCDARWRTLRDFGELLAKTKVSPGDDVDRFSDDETRTDYLVLRDATPREFLVRDFLPKHESGLVIAAGGVGKGHLQVALTLSGVTGEPLGPFETVRPFGVVIVTLEDDREEMLRRYTAALSARYGARKDWPKSLLEVVRQRLRIVDLRGRTDACLGRELRERVARVVERVENPGLVWLDPLGRLLPRGMPPGLLNSQDGGGFVLNELDALREATGCTVLASHHVNKQSKRDGSELSAVASSGSHMLSDLSRWVLNLRTVQEPSDFGLAPGHYVQAAVSKTNYTPPLDKPLVFQRVEGGALVHVAARSRNETDDTKVLATLLQHGDWLRGDGLDEASDLSRERARSARKRLVSAGSVVQQAVQQGRSRFVFYAPAVAVRPTSWPDEPSPEAS